MNEQYLHIDLCCGLGGWQQPFKEDEKWRSVGLDIREDLSPDVVADVRELPLNDCAPTLVTASPPCNEFSYWHFPWSPDDFTPSMELVNACLVAIEYLKPDYWILENVLGLHQYWKPADKKARPWYFWGDFPPFDFEPEGKGMGSLDRRQEPYNGGGNRGQEAAKIPHQIGESLRISVETWTD